jgi:hypothetical protein
MIQLCVTLMNSCVYTHVLNFVHSSRDTRHVPFCLSSLQREIIITYVYIRNKYYSCCTLEYSSTMWHSCGNKVNTVVSAGPQQAPVQHVSTDMSTRVQQTTHEKTSTSAPEEHSTRGARVKLECIRIRSARLHYSCSIQWLVGTAV